VPFKDAIKTANELLPKANFHVFSNFKEITYFCSRKTLEVAKADANDRNGIVYDREGNEIYKV
jgi:hypothetical protein